MNTFANRSLPVQLSLAKLFTFRWQFTIIAEKLFFFLLFCTSILGINHDFITLLRYCILM